MKLLVAWDENFAPVKRTELRGIFFHSPFYCYHGCFCSFCVSPQWSHAKISKTVISASLRLADGARSYTLELKSQATLISEGSVTFHIIIKLSQIMITETEMIIIFRITDNMDDLFC